MENKIKRILITGGTGFLGKNLARKLSSSGFCVTIIGRQEDPGIPKVIYIKADITNKDKVFSDLMNYDVIIHCAALASPFGKYENFYKANVIGTRNIVDFAFERGVRRFINISTPSIYFECSDNLNIKESFLPYKQFSHYSKTKLLADEIVQKAHEERGLEVITLRPRAIIGPEDKNIMPRLLGSSFFGMTPLIEGGRAVHDFTYIGNVVHAVELCINAPENCVGEVFNITNGTPIEIKDMYCRSLVATGRKVRFVSLPYSLLYGLSRFLEFVHKVLNIQGEPFLTKYGVSLFRYSQTLDISKAEKLLGYYPKVTLEEGLKKTLKYF